MNCIQMKKIERNAFSDVFTLFKMGPRDTNLSLEGSYQRNKHLKTKLVTSLQAELPLTSL